MTKNWIDLPKVAIIGRPNVGKSTLFNIMTHSRKAVVKDQAGVTRDLMFETAEVWGKSFDLIDTGGITEAKDVFSKMIKEQVSEFLHTVDLVVAVMDGRAGLLPEDRDIIRLIKQTGLPFVIIVNKIDSAHEGDIAISDFHEFGADVIPASFEQRRGLAEMLEWLHKSLPEQTSEPYIGSRIALVGKPNVGKSSLCNQLLGQNRMHVSDIAGTTIDSVDSPLTYNGKQYTLVDTAGLRRSSRREEDLEVISAFKSQEAIRRSEIILLLIDGMIGPTEQDAKILETIVDDHKGVIVVANKTDIAGKEIPQFKQKFREQIERNFHFFTDVPVVFISAKYGTGIDELFSEIERVSEKLAFRVATKDLNDFFFKVIRKAPSPVWGTKNIKFYYLTQTRQQPPSFIAFANHPGGVTPAYRRFLMKNIKAEWSLEGIPVRIFCMKSRRSGGDDGE